MFGSQKRLGLGVGSGFHFVIIRHEKLTKVDQSCGWWNPNKHLYNPSDIDTWQLIQNSFFEPVPRMELKDITRYEENKSMEWKKTHNPHVGACISFRELRFGRFDRVFLARSRVIAPNMELFYMKRRHLERLWGLSEKFLLESRL